VAPAPRNRDKVAARYRDRWLKDIETYDIKLQRQVQRQIAVRYRDTVYGYTPAPTLRTLTNTEQKIVLANLFPYGQYI
jgi:hypothetical protein